MKTRTKRITESAMLLALAIILELVAKMFIPEQPFGGQITLVSMLPVVLISYRHGVKWGFLASAGYAIIEMMLGMKNVSAAFLPGYFGDGTMIFNAILMCLMDYVVAFGVLGMGGVFRNRIQKPGISLMCGSLVALGARYLAHIVSGYILFSEYAVSFFTEDGFPAWGAQLVESLSPQALGIMYSVVYNGMFMIPEIILTAAMSLVIARIPGIVKKAS